MAIDLEVGMDIRGIRKALERIADVLEAALAETAPSPAGAQVDCDHPVELRRDFGVTNGVEDWECGVKDCGYRSIAQGDAHG